jgi:hypothetical protein
MRRFSFPNGVTVTVDTAAQRVQTQFVDGLVVDAIPVYDDESRARALELGFGSEEDPVWRMTATHDLLHSAVAHWLDWPYSYALRAVALGGQENRMRAAWEEALVMVIQRACNLGYAGLLDEFEQAAALQEGDESPDGPGVDWRRT